MGTRAHGVGAEQRQGARPEAGACRMASRRRGGSAGREGTAGPCEHRHDGKISAHPAPRRRDRARRALPDPQPADGEVGVNPRTRRTALYAIGAIAILASANAPAHSYAGLYDWAAHPRLTGWPAISTPSSLAALLPAGAPALS